MIEHSFTCGTCGQEHPGLPTDYAFGLPDDIYSLQYLERYKRSRSNADLCTLDDDASSSAVFCRFPLTHRTRSLSGGYGPKLTESSMICISLVITMISPTTHDSPRDLPMQYLVTMTRRV